MFEPFLELMADAVDTTATLMAILALWQGRPVRCKEMVARWLGMRPAARLDDVEDFVREARRVRASPASHLGDSHPKCLPSPSSRSSAARV
jgi:hypothetical protein